MHEYLWYVSCLLSLLQMHYASVFTPKVSYMSECFPWNEIDFYSLHQAIVPVFWDLKWFIVWMFYGWKNAICQIWLSLVELTYSSYSALTLRKCVIKWDTGRQTWLYRCSLRCILVVKLLTDWVFERCTRVSPTFQRTYMYFNEWDNINCLLRPFSTWLFHSDYAPLCGLSALNQTQPVVL